MDENEKPVAIVTGAGRGIGAAIATSLAAEGYRVVVADVDRAGAKNTAERIGGHAAACDVSDEKAVVDLIETTRSSHGRIDAIVSNAGVSEFGSLAETGLADWNKVIAINLTAAFLLAKHGEAALRASKGAMVLIASTRAHMSEPDTHAYAATKGGLVALCHSLAISLGPDVRCNCISPGWIDVAGDELSAEEHNQHPAGRVGKPEDVGSLAAYLVSHKAEFITGAEFIVDGGMTRKMIYQ